MLWDLGERVLRVTPSAVQEACGVLVRGRLGTATENAGSAWGRTQGTLT